MEKIKVIIMGAAGRDFHNFNTFYRDNENYDVVAFTATRWGSLLRGHDKWPGEMPSAGECYRFCLSNAAVHVVPLSGYHRLHCTSSCPCTTCATSCPVSNFPDFHDNEDL